jgi:hypothetical protein
MEGEPTLSQAKQEYLPAKNPERYAEFKAVMMAALEAQPSHVREKDDVWCQYKQDTGSDLPHTYVEVERRLFDPNRYECLVYLGPAQVDDDSTMIPLTVVSMFGTLPQPVIVDRKLVVPKSAPPGTIKILARRFINMLWRILGGSE